VGDLWRDAAALANHPAEFDYLWANLCADWHEGQLPSSVEGASMNAAPAICVFCSSSDAIERNYFGAALELGMEIGLRNGTLIFGGTNVGLMGAVARATQKHGGKVVGVLPDFMRAKGIAYTDADELIIAKDMRERKATMESKGDAFVALPGGFGTLEEMIEIITLKQLKQHTKPAVFLNINNFYRPLQRLFDHMITQNFAKEAMRKIYHFADDAPVAFKYIDEYEPPTMDEKWALSAEIGEISTGRE
jgi:cytokinin riboside 5'-monophosphate phosphoribohydrolase